MPYISDLSHLINITESQKSHSHSQVDLEASVERYKELLSKTNSVKLLTRLSKKATKSD